jgi:hypothetical protein
MNLPLASVVIVRSLTPVLWLIISTLAFGIAAPVGSLIVLRWLLAPALSESRGTERNHKEIPRKAHPGIESLVLADRMLFLILCASEPDDGNRLVRTELEAV